MSEQPTSLLVATSDPSADGPYCQYMIMDDMVAFAKDDNRLIIDEKGQLWLLNKKMFDMMEAVKKEPGMIPLPFQKSSSCVKCSTVNDFSKSKTVFDKIKNLLHRECRTCGYEWFEYPADYKEISDGKNESNEAS